MLKNYLITYLTSCENLKFIKVGVSNPDLALLFIPLCARTLRRVEGVVGGRRRLLRRRGSGVGGAVVVRGRVGDVEVVRLAIRRIRLGGPLPRRTLAQAVRPRFDVGAISCRSGPNSVQAGYFNRLFLRLTRKILRLFRRL